MKILVTGGCGFIASHIADAYINAGHKVFIIDDLSTGDENNLNPKAIFHRMDICDPGIGKIFNDERFDIVNHHAAQINVRTSVEDPLKDARINIIGSLNLLDNVVRTGVKRFIFASSGGTVYGEPKSFPITEAFPIQPASPYGISKATVERYISILTDGRGIDHVILRYSNVYGPRQIAKSEAGVISIFINQIIHNGVCSIFGDGNQTRDYVYVKDVVNANIIALNCPPGTYNIGTGIETSVNTLLDILGKILGNKIEHKNEPARPGEVLRNALDPSRAGKKINWRPTTSLSQGIGDTYHYFNQYNGQDQLSQS